MRSTSSSSSSILSYNILQQFYIVLAILLTCNIPYAITTSPNELKSASEIFENDVFSSILNADNVDSLTTDADGNIGSTNLIFQPASIDFNQNAIGEPQSRVITVFNRHRNQSVYLGSISGNVQDFYTSYFSDKVIPPEGNATFNIVFLPRKLGSALGLLMIHTSFGLIKYDVKGEGVECPYRLTPLINLKAPLNATISPEILMYNYHSKPLQIVEVYSSGGAFQLELPSGKQEGPQALWEIPPFSTKSVIRVKFNGKTPGNHTAYVRIKISATNDPSLSNRMLVVPIEVEIFSHTGVYSNTPFLDFGFLGAAGGLNRSTIERRNISLFNSRKDEGVDLKAWRIESKESPEVVECMKLEINKDRIALEFDWTKIRQNERFNGEIVLQTSSRSSDEYRIPFTGRIVKGNLLYDVKSLQFLLNTDNFLAQMRDDDEQTNDSDSNFLFESSIMQQVERTFELTNNFSSPLNVINLTTIDSSNHGDNRKNQPVVDQHLKIIGFKPTTIIQPNETVNLFRLSLINIRSLLTSLPSTNNNNNRLPITFQLQLHTNISVYELPIHIFNGRLQRLVPLEVTNYDGTNANDDQFLNFGILPVAQPHRGLIAFVNPNPVPVQVTNFRMKSPDGTYMSVTLRGCGPHQLEKLYLCNKIEPGDWIVFEIAVKSQAVGNYSGKFVVTTEVEGTFMEEIITPVLFTTAMGRLELDKDLLHFTECYPGKLCSLNLSAYSTFIKKMQVELIQPETAGISYVFASDDAFPEILPNVVTDIGRLYFNPKELCKNDCYTSFEILSNATAARWMSTLNNFNEYRKLDLDWLAYRQSLYLKAKKMLKTISFKLTTNTVKRHEFNASVNLIWPKFLPNNINFPTLQIDQEAVKFITIANPTDHLLLVHYVLHDVNNHGSKIYTPTFVSKDCSNCTLSNGENVFSFLNEETEVFIQDIPPNSYAKIGIRFSSNEPGTYSTVLYLRNNLTVVESVWITARAVQPLFKFGNRKSGSQTPLIFEVTDNHLKACDKPQTNYSPFVTIKRTFTAKNYGEVPITVYGLRVENNPCEGFGFKILNCHPFELAPNASEKIEIEFSPDFTLARLTRTLFLHTSMNYLVNFTLLGTVPPYALEKCNKAIIRPTWESNYRRISAGILTIAFFLVILTAFLDSDKVLRDHLQNISRDRGPVQPPLDLRQIAVSMQQESQQQQQQQQGFNHSNLNNNSSASQKTHQKDSHQVTRRKNAKSSSNSMKMNNGTENGHHENNKTGRYATNNNNNNSSKKPVNHENSSSSNNSSNRNNKRNNQQNREKQQHQRRLQSSKNEVVVEAEETSSTTTESSFNSDDSDSRSTNTRSSPKSESPVTIQPSTVEFVQNQSTSNGNGKSSKGNSKKNNVKKSKSLPLTQFNDNEISGQKECQIESQNYAKDEPIEQINFNGKFNSSNGPDDVCHENGKIELITPESNMNEFNTQKLPGKTPGRERKSGGHQPIKNSTNMKQLTFKNAATGFKFDSNEVCQKNNHVSFLPQATASIWTENRATFSDVVAQQPLIGTQNVQEPALKPNKMMKNPYGEQQKANRRSAGDVPMNSSQNMGNLGLGGGNMFNNNNNNNNTKRNLMFGGRVKDDLSLFRSMEEPKSVISQNFDGFGPIGTPLLSRNSPPFMQQQNWDSMNNQMGVPNTIQQPTASMSNYPTQTRSRFLDAFPTRQPDNVNYSQSQDSNILEAANLMSQFPVWNADPNILLEMFNRQQQQEQLDAWNRSNNAWNPMNYSNTPTASTQNHMNSAGQWPITVRPPPGLSLNRDRQQPQNQMMQQQQQQQSSHISSRAEDTILSSNNNNNNNNNIDSTGSQGAGGGETMRTYDPFKSLSYLWQGSTDLWGASNNNNNNNNNKKQE